MYTQNWRQKNKTRPLTQETLRQGAFFDALDACCYPSRASSSPRAAGGPLRMDRAIPSRYR